LQAACEATDDGLSNVILDSANITLINGDLSEGCYDSLGNKYVIPKYCITKPTNIIADDFPSNNRFGEKSKKDSFDIGNGRPSTPPFNSKSRKPTMDSSGRINLCVRLSSGKDVKFLINDSESISVVKSKLLQTETTLQKANIRFMCVGRILSDDNKISELSQFVRPGNNSDLQSLLIQAMIIGS
jgi:hypothetical protein